MRISEPTRGIMRDSHRNICFDAGFSLAEFLLSTAILLLISAAVFRMMSETQRASSYQTEVHAVMDNTRIAMDTIERYIRQAGNDPTNLGFQGVQIVSTSPPTLQLRSNLTGSVNSDQGDPDNDTNDSGEDVTFSYNSSTKSITMTPNGGAAQQIANYISALNFEYFNAAGTAETVGANVRKIRVTVTGSSTLAHPQTGKTYGQVLSSDVQISSRF